MPAIRAAQEGGIQNGRYPGNQWPNPIYVQALIEGSDEIEFGFSECDFIETGLRHGKGHGGLGGGQGSLRFGQFRFALSPAGPRVPGVQAHENLPLPDTAVFLDEHFVRIAEQTMGLDPAEGGSVADL